MYCFLFCRTNYTKIKELKKTNVGLERNKKMQIKTFVTVSHQCVLQKHHKHKRANTRLATAVNLKRMKFPQK